MIFDNIKKYLLVFPALLLVVGNIGFCSEMNVDNANNINDLKASIDCDDNDIHIHSKNETIMNNHNNTNLYNYITKNKKALKRETIIEQIKTH